MSKEEDAMKFVLEAVAVVMGAGILALLSFAKGK